MFVQPDTSSQSIHAMKLIFSTTLALYCLVATTHGSPTPLLVDEPLTSRLDNLPLHVPGYCGASYPPYTRVSGDACLSLEQGQTYCSCDRTRVVSTPPLLRCRYCFTNGVQVECKELQWRDSTDCEARGKICGALLGEDEAYCYDEGL